MAIVLEVSLTLNPGNQIAYLADDTGLVVGTEYVIAGTHLAADTRFTYNGNLDIVLTKQPIAVPTNNFVTPVSINTVPTAAPAPPVAVYPYSVKNQLAAPSLNHDLEFSPGPLPPHSALGGAGRYKYWMDTSTTPATLRQCVVARAATTYNAAEWAAIGTVDGTGFKLTGYLPLTGGTLTGQLNINSGYASIALVKPAAGTSCQLLGQTGANLRWNLVLGDSAAETGSNAGSNFSIGRWNDAGSGIDAPLTINRATGVMNLSQPLPITSGGTGSTSASQSLVNLGALPLSGGTITGNLGVTGSVNAGGGTFAGLTVNGGSGFNGAVTITGNLLAGNTTVGALTAAQEHVTGLFGVDGLTTLTNVNITSNSHIYGACQVDHGIQYPNYGLANPAVNIGFGYSFNSGTVLWVVANDAFVGTVTVNTSDERLKRDIGPVTVDPLASLCQVQLKAFDQLSTRLDPADGVQHRDVGFIAQQLRGVIPDAVIEPPPNAFLSVDLMPLVAYCVGAIQQLTERLEALEGAR